MEVITPNPKTSGGARLNYLAAWGYSLKRHDPNYPHTKERKATIYMRPHELDIRREANCDPSLQAQVMRINPAGSTAKVTLRTTAGRDLVVDLPLERYRELLLQKNDSVFVYPKQSRVFVPDDLPDYAI